MHQGLLVALLATACAPSTADRYTSDVATLRALVSDHVAAVRAATTLDEVTALEATYATDWGDRMGGMGDTMSTLHDCPMMGDGGGMMSEAMGMMHDMDEEMAEHMAHHGDHTDVAQCMDEESTHADVMDDCLDTMDDDADGMHCDGSMMH